MLFAGLVSLLFAGVALGQTPAGFSPNVTASLVVKYGTKTVTPGLLLTKSDTATKPTIGTADMALNGTYIFFMIDLDVPGQYAGLPAGSRSTNLHALLPGYSSATTATNGVYLLSSTTTAVVSYVAPAPPAETPVHPHKYMQLLYEQPAGFAVPASQKAAVSKGVGFNVTSFAIDAKLGDPVRANYFTESG